MKKHLVLGALAVLALAACTKSEVVELNKGNEISLTAVTGKNLTKAADGSGYCNNNLPADFQVWAATQGKTYFADQKYKKSGTSYIADGAARYWPDGTATVDFFAVKNHNGTATFTNSGTTALEFADYTVADDVDKQTDFIYAVNKDQGKPSGGAAAPLNFRHALSQIEFRAKNGNKNIRVFIDGVQVVNVKNTGNFTMTKATTTAFVDHDSSPEHNDKNDITNDIDTRGDRGTWAGQSGNATYSVSFGEVEVRGNETAVNLTYLGTAKAFDTYSMYLLPQTFDNVWGGKATDGAASTSGKSYFVVNALIYNDKDANPSLTFVKDDNVVLWGDNTSGSWKTKPIAVQLPADMKWEDGFRYLYTFNFTNYGVGGTDPGSGDPVLTPITLEVTVDDFVDVADKEVEVK